MPRVIKKRTNDVFLLAIIAVSFFLLTFLLGRPPGGVWNSPDETANAFWAGRVAAGQAPLLRDPVVGLGGGAVHPRSFAVYGDAIVPGSFPGLFLLYGAVNFFTRLPLAALTPILTALAGVVFFLNMRRLFESRIAFLAAVLFYLHPAVIYYAGRGLFHNLLFVDLLIFAAALFVLRPMHFVFGKNETLDDFFGGLLFGAGLITRMSEAPWVLLAAAVFIPFVKKDRWKRLLAAAAGLALPLFLFMYFNSITHGSPFSTGYAVPSLPASVPGTSAPGASQTERQLLPFGFHPRLVALNVWNYGLKFFWWLAAPAALGAAVFLSRWRKETALRKTYFCLALGVAVWLAVFYGSWFVRDRYDPWQVTIGTSYVRYFLPVYVLSLPFASAGLLWINERFHGRRPWLLRSLVLLAAILSLRIAVIGGDESLIAVRRTLIGNAAKKEILLKWIPEDAAVMTDRFDKVLFPERLRILPLQDEASFDAASVLINYVPVMYYGLDLGDQELSALRELAGRRGLDLEEVGRPVAGETLYRFIKR